MRVSICLFLAVACALKAREKAYGKQAASLPKPKEKTDTADLGNPLSCSHPEMSGKPNCMCPVMDYYACKLPYACKDMFGFCDPASSVRGRTVAKMISFDEYNVTCDTMVLNMNGYPTLECKESFVADFMYKGKPAVCYESAINAPKQYDVFNFKWASYAESMLTSQQAGFPFLYASSKLEPISCSQRGFYYDKKVHPCLRHAYTLFMDPDAQEAYRKHREAEIEAHPNDWAIVGEQMSNMAAKFTDPSSANLTTTEGMYAGNCNYGT